MPDDEVESTGEHEREPLSEAPTLARLDSEASPETAAPGRLSPGQRFGSYEIIRLLGKGGMGEVYEAYDTRAERHVALKVLAERLVADVDRGRFLREGQLAAQVSHPNSVFVFGTEEVDGAPTISMGGGPRLAILAGWLRRPDCAPGLCPRRNP